MWTDESGSVFSALACHIAWDWIICYDSCTGIDNTDSVSISVSTNKNVGSQNEILPGTLQTLLMFSEPEIDSDNYGINHYLLEWLLKISR